MTERPISYSPDMVKARRSGQKTKTRRAMRFPKGYDVDHAAMQRMVDRADRDLLAKCPYGKPGDRLWVKEEHWLFGVWKVAGRNEAGKVKWRFEIDRSMGVQFDTPQSYVTGRSTASPAWHKRIGMFMPRWASRGLDEVVSVRVERLQNISETDALAEGIVHEIRDPGLGRGGRPGYRWANNEYAGTAAHGYEMLWQAINGAGSWDLNPWVWVIEFKVITP